MDNNSFISRKPKPSWSQAQQLLSDKSGFPRSSITPNTMIGPVGNHIEEVASGGDILGHGDVHLAAGQLRTYGNTKRGRSR